MRLIQLSSLFCALLFTITRIINIRVTKSDELTVKINFNIFAILLTEDKLKRNGFRKASKLIKSIKNIIKPIEYLMSKTEVRVYKLPTSIQQGEILRTFYSLSFITSFSFIFSYLENNSRCLRFIKLKDDSSEYNATFFDFSFHFSIWNMIIFSFLFLYYTIRSKVKRVIKNV